MKDEYKEIIIRKLTSGKFILTVLGGGVFVLAVIRGILSAEAIASIITMIFVSYFNREKKGGTQ